MDKKLNLLNNWKYNTIKNNMDNTLTSFTDVLDDEICNSQPISLSSSTQSQTLWLSENNVNERDTCTVDRPHKGTGQRGQFRSIEEIDLKYRDVFSYPYFNLVQSKVIDDALYSDKSIVVCAPTGSGKTVVFEMAIVQLLMELDDKKYTEDFKIIYMAPVKALCTERLTEWYPKFTKLGLMCIEVTGDTDVDFTQLQPYKIIITTPEKWDMLTRRWRDHRSLVEVIKLFLIDEVHILNDDTRGPVLEAVVSRMKTIEGSAQSVHRIEQLQNQLHGSAMTHKTAPSIRFVAVSATVSNPEDVANWLGSSHKPAVFHKFGDECRPVKVKRIVEGYPCPEGTSIFKFDIILNYKLWPVIQKYHSGKPTLIFCNTRKSVTLTAETLSRELTVNFNAEQRAKLIALASTIKNKKLQSLVMSGVGCHHAGLLYEERQSIERAFRNRDLPILITTTTLAMGVNLPAHLVIIKNTQQYVNGAFQEYSISTVLQMVGRAGRPQFDTEATAVIMTRYADKSRYEALVGGCEPLQSYLHKRLPENLNSEAALGTVGDVAQCVQWLRSTFLYVRASRDPKKYLGLPQNSPQHLISKKIEELCVKAMNGLASSGLITMDEASCIESTEAGRLMSIFYLDVATMKQLMTIKGSETLENLLSLVCESHELSDMHLRVDERRCLNTLNRNNTAATIRFPMKGKISTRQMKLNCIIQAVLGCLSIPDPSLNQEAMKIIRIADRICKCLVSYVTRPDLISRQPEFYSAVLNSIILAKCIAVHLWENSPFVSKQLKGIGPTFSALLATAGKVNFRLLEESHPRDLERIMNKSAPAGNILRRQVSLLPKYHLTMTPVDETTVMVQLDLLNQSYLAENMKQLTAGGKHKSYILVGDSTNHLLLLAAFNDKDLITVFDGTIKYEIRRIHNYEHKIFAHCISTALVGVDQESEYIFNNLYNFFGPSYSNAIEEETMKKQTYITDTFKKRKRKSSTDVDKTQSNEKRNRENAIIKNFKYLKKSFETASKNVKENLNLSTKNQTILSDNVITIPDKTIEMNDATYPMICDINLTKGIDSDESMGDVENIDNILTKIENEMSNRKECAINKNSLYSTNMQHIAQTRNPSFNDTKQRKSLLVKSNYAFIDALENRIDIDNEDKNIANSKNNGFSDTIKSHISKYLQKTEIKSKTRDPNVQLLLEDKERTTTNTNTDVIEIAVDNNDVTSMHKPYPQYEIKEILGKQHNTIENEETCQEVQRKSLKKSNIDISKLSNLQNNNESSKTKEEYNKTDINEIDIVSDSLSKQNDHKGEHHSNKVHVDHSSCQVQTNSVMDFVEQELTTCTDESIDEIFVTPKDTYLINDNCIYSTNLTRLRSFSSDFEEKSLKLNTISDTDYKNLNTSDIQKNIPSEVTQNFCQNEVALFYENKCVDHRIEQARSDQLIINSKRNNTSSSNRAFCDYTNQVTRESIFTKKLVSTIISKQFQTNIIKKPILINNHLPNFEIKATYVKNNSVSKTLVNGQSKQIANRCIRVINEINFNLNVTESIFIADPSDILESEIKIEQHNEKLDKVNYIELNGDNLGNRRTLNAIKYKEEPTNDTLRNVHAKYKTLSYPINSNKVIIANINTKLSENKYSRIGEINNKNTAYQDSHTIPKEEIDTVMLKSNNATNSNNSTNKTLREENYSTNNEMIYNNTICRDSSDPKIEMNCTNTVSNINENISGIIGGPNDANTVSELANEQESSDHTDKKYRKGIQTILQKYSKMLRRDIAINQTPTYTISHQNTSPTLNDSPIPKTKKPFKISNIKNLEATLPDTLITNNTQHAEYNEPIVMTRIGENNPILDNHRQINTSCGVPFDVGSPANEFVPQYSLSDLDLVPVHIPLQMDVKPDTNLNIDESMFDPKTLLQYSVNPGNNEVIAPPPQFCDNDFNVHSPNQFDLTNIEQWDKSQFGCSSDKHFNINESIFEDHCTTNLTPSREIETWTLAEDHLEDQSSILSPLKSFTVMRRNKSKYHEMSTKNALEITRPAKLGKFQFTPKDKLRKWK